MEPYSGWGTMNRKNLVSVTHKELKFEIAMDIIMGPWAKQYRLQLARSPLHAKTQKLPQVAILPPPKLSKVFLLFCALVSIA